MAVLLTNMKALARDMNRCCDRMYGRDHHGGRHQRR